MNVLRKNHNLIYKLMKLYTAIGEELEASPSKVERNIRHALEGARSDFHIQKKVLGTAKEMTTGEFLGTMYEAIYLKLDGAV